MIELSSRITGTSQAQDAARIGDATMTAATERGVPVAVFEFRGTFEETDGILFAVCEHAPLVAQGSNEDDALEHMKRLITLYLHTLRSKGELNAAIDKGEVRVRILEQEQKPSLTIIRNERRFEAQADLAQAA